jgi:hypothetical protein
MWSPVKPMIKLKASFHSNREHFLHSDQLHSSVEPMQFKEIIDWSPTASLDAEKMHSSFKPTLVRGQHRFDRRNYFFWQTFLQRLYWTCCLYKRPQWLPFSSLDSPDIKYTLLRFESNKENILSSSILSSHQDSSGGQEIELGHSFLVFDPAQVKVRACYSWWLTSPRRSWWSGSFEACRGHCRSPKEVLVTLYMVWAPPYRRWQTETPSERPLSMWHGRWHNPLWCHNVD